MVRQYREYTNEQFIEAIKTSNSMSQVLKKIGLSLSGGNFKLAKSRIKDLKVDNSHFRGQSYLKGKTHNWTKSIPLEEILVENSSYSRSSLKKRLLKKGLLENKCYNCGLTEWLDKPISIQLEHKNGANKDNRIDNLTFLCPNCHSQTSTYAGKNTKKKKKEYHCKECGKKITKSSRSGLCVSCVKVRK